MWTKCKLVSSFLKCNPNFWSLGKSVVHWSNITHRFGHDVSRRLQFHHLMMIPQFYKQITSWNNKNKSFGQQFHPNTPLCTGAFYPRRYLLYGKIGFWRVLLSAKKAQLASRDMTLTLSFFFTLTSRQVNVTYILHTGDSLFPMVPPWRAAKELRMLSVS